MAAVRVVVLGDTHGQHGEIKRIPYGDVLVHVGDFTDSGSLYEVKAFCTWLDQQPHKHKVVVCGSHSAGMRST